MLTVDIKVAPKQMVVSKLVSRSSEIVMVMIQAWLEH